MAASPFWKVYQAKEYRAACKYVEDAAALVAFLGDGAQIRAEHTLVLWHEGQESQPAAESYDHVAEVVSKRLQEHRAKVKEKLECETARHEARHSARAASGATS